MLLGVVWQLVAEKNHSPKILGSMIRRKRSKLGGDSTPLLCLGETVANSTAFSSWDQLIKEF